ncbi:MAG TPA: EamA family transporter [Steroidobacteraceae bacterium]|nr:EamA family transporter [Steroidobacteraceae bacterium]
MHSARPPRWKILIAFAIIYFVWGSTFYAIRVGVHEVPPLLLAAARFSIAGALLFGWALARGERWPSRREWAGIAIVAFLIFVMDYGFLFWAEKRVPSGSAAVILAIIPAFMALAEIIVLRTERLTFRLSAALLIGLGGVVVLMDPALGGGAPVYSLGAAGLLVAALSWSAAAVLTRKLPLPSSKVMSAAAQMLSGGVFLWIIAAAAGEARGFHATAISLAAWMALLYLIVAGSIVAFTAYTWLIHHESPTRVGTYAYVNPVVAVVVGHFMGGEVLNARTVLGTVLVLVSVIVITTRSKSNTAPAAPKPTGLADIQPDTQP